MTGCWKNFDNQKNPKELDMETTSWRKQPHINAGILLLFYFAIYCIPSTPFPPPSRTLSWILTTGVQAVHIVHKYSR